MEVPVPDAPHDIRLVVAVQPSGSEAPGDADHGVGTIDLIRSGGLMSFTGLDGHCRVVCARNVAVAAGGVIFAANLSGTITLRGGPPGKLYVFNSGPAARTVHVRWVH
jgi:hypothetical protein